MIGNLIKRAKEIYFDDKNINVKGLKANNVQEILEKFINILYPNTITYDISQASNGVVALTINGLERGGIYEIETSFNPNGNGSWVYRSTYIGYLGIMGGYDGSLFIGASYKSIMALSGGTDMLDVPPTVTLSNGSNKVHYESFDGKVIIKYPVGGTVVNFYSVKIRRVD
jgi:hypothetical protein